MTDDKLHTIKQRRSDLDDYEKAVADDWYNGLSKEQREIFFHLVCRAGHVCFHVFERASKEFEPELHEWKSKREDKK